MKELCREMGLQNSFPRPPVEAPDCTSPDGKAKEIEERIAAVALEESEKE